MSPLLALYGFQGKAIPLDARLFSQARWNTLFLAFGVLAISGILGFSLAYFKTFYIFPLRRFLHFLMMLPLAFPAYVLAFVYLAQTSGSSFVFLQGELWFLILVLGVSLTPYVYYFSSLGLSSVTQSEWETEKLLSGGSLKFFLFNTGPKVFPFFLSALVLVLFESLSDFGAASVINVPVITTMIYKVWFDLFSFAGAVRLATQYSFLILLLLLVEAFLKKSHDGDSGTRRDPLHGEKASPVLSFFILVFMFSYFLLGFLLPTGVLLFWSMGSQAWQWVSEVLSATIVTLGLGLSAGLLVVFFSVVLQVALRYQNIKGNRWMLASTIGYSLPGSVLAVGVYALLLKMTSDLTQTVLLLGLVLALAYKFLTVAMRPIGQAACQLPTELIETSHLVSAPFLKQVRYFIWPYMKDASLVGLVLVSIEVMKEMPLTLMLAPSEVQSLSIQIFNFTSEGEWEKASLPSLMLLVVGLFSVYILMKQEKNA